LGRVPPRNDNNLEGPGTSARSLRCGITSFGILRMWHGSAELALSFLLTSFELTWLRLTGRGEFVGSRTGAMLRRCSLSNSRRRGRTSRRASRHPRRSLSYSGESLIRIAALRATGSFTFRLLRLNSRRKQLREQMETHPESLPYPTKLRWPQPLPLISERPDRVFNPGYEATGARSDLRPC
jgi:hypothetical protein